MITSFTKRHAPCGRKNCGPCSAHMFTATSQHDVRILAKSPFLMAVLMCSPVRSTIRPLSRLPRSISFVTVCANPFHEIRKPSRQRAKSFMNELANSGRPLFGRHRPPTGRAAERIENRFRDLVLARPLLLPSHGRSAHQAEDTMTRLRSLALAPTLLAGAGGAALVARNTKSFGL